MDRVAVQEQPFAGTSVDADGVIQTHRPGRAVALRQPALMKNALEGAYATLRRVAEALVDVDVTIGSYADLLTRAQPLNSGRVVIVFSKSYRVRVNGEIRFDTVPVAMRMVLYVDGSWHLRRAPAFEKLEELRVGKTLPSDRLVVQVLRELDNMMKVRAELMELLSDFRKPSIPVTRKAVALANTAIERLPVLQGRLKLDWKTDAEGCRIAIRNERKKTAEARKLKAASKRKAGL